MSVLNAILTIRAEKGAGFIVLIDPDKLPEHRLPAFAERCARADVDGFFFGGSLMHATELDRYVRTLKESSDLPVIGFPGSLNQIAPSLDAVLFLSVISSRNAEFLIGQHVYAAPLIKRMGIEPIATGYMLIESGRMTTAAFMSSSIPIPRHKPEIAAASALAAEMLGMKLVFTDGGSGAEQTVPEEMISAITEACSLPLVVGGGISTPEEVQRKVSSGASFIVVGNAIEQRSERDYIAELAAAAHAGVSKEVS